MEVNYSNIEMLKKLRTVFKEMESLANILKKG